MDYKEALLKVVSFVSENFEINFEAFDEMMSENVQAVLINTPNNPSGIAYSEQTIERLANYLRE